MSRYKDEPSYNIKFVQEVEKYPCVYNYKLPEYSRKDITAHAWQKIAKEMKDTVAGCKERWKNLRTVFVRKLKPALGGSTRRGKRAYYLKESMRFLLPHLKVVHSTHNPEDFLSPIKADNSGDVEEEFESDPLNIPVDDEDEVPGASGLQQYYDPPPPEDCPHGLVGRMSAASCVDERETCPNLTDSRSFIEFLNLEKSRSTCDDDPRKQFLLSLLPDIKQMTDVQMRRFKIKVLNLVEDILSEVPIGSTRD